jgi:hypothetical protein
VNAMASTEGRSAVNPVRVVSCVIARDPARGEILLGVRRPTPVSLRHPGVLSTPTMRIPACLFDTLLDAGGIAELHAGVVLIPGGRQADIGVAGSLGSPEAFVLESLLARKLGLARALTLGYFQAGAVLAAAALDLVEDPQGGDEAEWTAMLTYEVNVLTGADLIDAKTDAYSRLIWAPADRITDAFRRHDALLVDESLNPFEVCIGGLCIKSAVRLLQKPR